MRKLSRKGTALPFTHADRLSRFFDSGTESIYGPSPYMVTAAIMD
jgi:hypothetical protein